MATIRWAVSVVTAGLLVGCADTKKAAENNIQPPSVQGTGISVDDARAQFKTANPLSSVGVVKSTIKADQGLIAAGDLPADAVAAGDVVSIVAPDTQYTLVANGVVQSFSGPYVIISFTDAKRMPENGDLVVRLPMTPHVAAHRPGMEAPSSPVTPALGAPATTPGTDTTTPAPAPTAPAPTAPPATDTPAPTPAPAPAPAPTTPPAADTPAPAPTAPPATDTPAPAPSTTETPKPADSAPKTGELNK